VSVLGLAFFTVAAQSPGGFNRMPVDLVKAKGRYDKDIEASDVSAGKTLVTIEPDCERPKGLRRYLWIYFDSLRR
jgi:hypothetical protein